VGTSCHGTVALINPALVVFITGDLASLGRIHSTELSA
jgi:hypothetical protein